MNTTVITTMKNEGAFLLEWVAHHKALGFDNIVICTNDCADPTTDMAMRLQKLGIVRHHSTIYKPGLSIQRIALRQARRFNQVQGADWIYVCDADEFLTIKIGDGSLSALINAASPEAEVIAVPWRVFGLDARRYDAATASWLETLRADARLNMLHSRAVNWHIKKIEDLKKRPDVQAMMAAIEERRGASLPS